MSEHSHFLLGSHYASQYDAFQPKTPPIEGMPVPERDRHAHYNILKTAYDCTISSTTESLEQFNQNNHFSADGIYIDFHLANGSQSIKSLDSKTAARLMNIFPIEENEDTHCSSKATVYLPMSKKDWLDKKLESYNNPDNDTDNGPRHSKLINDINSIQRTSLSSFFSNPNDFNSIIPNELSWYEIWIGNYDENTVVNIFENVRRLGIEISERYISFALTSVFLIHATLSDLEKLPLALNYLSEIRRSKQPSLLHSGDLIEHQEWIELLKASINIEMADSSPIIGIIDTGVNNAHPLIRDFLPNDRTDCVISGHEHIDNDGHGTEMSGICLYGDLTNLIYERGDIVVRHRLASVKIFSEYLRNLNHQELYGVLTELAVEKLERMGASIFCLSITEDDENCWGNPSSWSADIDKILYHDGICDRLMLVSAGNIRDHENLTQDTYQDYCVSQKAQSPAQALNAITVGAYTDKVIDNQYGNNGFPLAPPQEISPYSRTSSLWDLKRIKPDIVMEGGNILMHNVLGALSSTDLSLITTSSNLNSGFQTFNATSAATALASNLAAKIKVRYPELSSLGIRALMVHSAEWSSSMKATAKDFRLSMYGYGIPSEFRALNSLDNYATCIFENVLTPYRQGANGSLKYAGFQIYALPWPSGLLESMGDEVVRLKVTLSYYIDPAPGEKGRLNKYRYPNAALYFDLKAPTESLESFIARHNKLEDAENTASTASSRWEIGVRRRQSNTVQSDWIECTAAELSECGQIMIYPGPGWWKEQKIDRIGNNIKYALVVSIETSETPIYSEIAQIISNQIPVETRV